MFYHVQSNCKFDIFIDELSIISLSHWSRSPAMSCLGEFFLFYTLGFDVDAVNDEKYVCNSKNVMFDKAWGYNK